MTLHQWARAALAQQLESARDSGLDETLALRALLSVLVERSAQVRDVVDLAHELQFLADNLDGERDYSFMRP